MKRQWLTTIGTLLLGGVIGWWLSSESRQMTLLAQRPVDTTDTAPPDNQKPSAGDADAADATESPLLTLDWLIGSWAESAAPGEESRGIHFTCQFTQNKAFILRSFTAGSGDSEMSGMQVVAWDPAEETIRSWTFDSEGGFGQEVWSQSGNRYTIRKKYTLPDGGKASSMNILTYVNDNQFTWRSVQREIDGALQPDIETILLVRTDETPGAEGAEAVEPAANATEAVETQTEDAPGNTTENEKGE